MSLFFCGTRTWIYIFNFQSQVSICEALVLNSIDLVSLKSHCYVDHYKNACFIKRKPWNYFKRFWHRFREGYHSSYFYKNERILAKYRDSRYVDTDSQRYSCKSMLQNYAANLHKGSLQGRSLISWMHGPSTTPRIALPCFHLRNCKRLLQVVWIP